MSALKMQFIPESQILFPYIAGKHLLGGLQIINKNDFAIVYKFKASTVNRFVIKPNQGCLKPGQSLDVQIVFHKDGVANYEAQKIQVVYGKTYEDAQSKLYSLCIENFLKNDNLNLTMRVEQKQKRVKNLQKQIQDYQLMPKSIIGGSGTSGSGKSGLKFKNLITVLIIGFLCGFFSPVRMFRKGGVLAFIVQADTLAVEKSQQS